MKYFIYSLIILTLLLYHGNAELLFTLSVETKAGYNLNDNIICLENEIVVEKEFDILNGLIIGLENLIIT